MFVNEIAKLILHYLRTTFAKDLITREAIIQVNTLSPNLTVSLLFIGSLDHRHCHHCIGHRHYHYWCIDHRHYHHYQLTG